MPPDIYQRLIAHPAFHGFPASLMRLWLQSATAHPVIAGECWAGDLALVDSVQVLLPDDAHLTVQIAGLEALSGQAPPSAILQAGENGWLVHMPTTVLREAMRHDGTISDRLAVWIAAPNAPDDSARATPERRPYAWLGAIALPAALWIGLPHLGLSEAATSYLASVSIGFWVWLRNLAPPFVGALLILTALVLSGTVSGPVAFGGFSDAGVLLLISILALGYVTQASGLAQRLMQLLLRHMQTTARGFHGGLLGLGFVLTLILPSSVARIQLISSITAQLGKRVAAAGRPSAHLALAAFSGVTAISTVFLTSNPVNFLVLGLLPEQWRQHFGWATWLQASLGYLLPFLLLYGVLFWYMTHRVGSISLPKGPAVTVRQWRGDEVVAAAAIALFVVGAAGANLVHLSVPIAGLAVYLWLSSYGFLKEDKSQPQINWPMVLYLTAMIGLVRGFNALGLDHELGHALQWLPALAQWNPSVFVVVLVAITVLLRLVLPALVCVSVLCVMLIPLMGQSSVNPWLIAFVVSTTAEGGFLPYQSSDYQLFRACMGNALDKDEAQFIRFNALVQAIKLLALVVAIPYWIWLGIL